jgi:hypothetical protein
VRERKNVIAAINDDNRQFSSSATASAAAVIHNRSEVSLMIFKNE